MTPVAYMDCERVRLVGDLEAHHPTGSGRKQVLDAVLQAQASCRPHSISGPWATQLVEKLEAERAVGKW